MSDIPFIVSCTLLSVLSVGSLVATPFVNKKKKILKLTNKNKKINIEKTKEVFELKWILSPEKKQSIRTQYSNFGILTVSEDGRQVAVGSPFYEQGATFVYICDDSCKQEEIFIANPKEFQLGKLTKLSSDGLILGISSLQNIKIYLKNMSFVETKWSLASIIEIKDEIKCIEIYKNSLFVSTINELIHYQQSINGDKKHYFKQNVYKIPGISHIIGTEDGILIANEFSVYMIQENDQIEIFSAASQAKKIESLFCFNEFLYIGLIYKNQGSVVVLKNYEKEPFKIIEIPNEDACYVCAYYDLMGIGSPLNNKFYIYKDFNLIQTLTYNEDQGFFSDFGKYAAFSKNKLMISATGANENGAVFIYN